MINSRKIDGLNIERLIIYTVVLLIILIFILQTNLSILTIVPFTFVYFFVIIFNIMLPSLKNEQQDDYLKNKEAFFFNTSLINVDKFKKRIAKNYYYDNENFYKINKTSQKSIVIPFADIIEVSKTAVVINNVRLWRVVAQYDDKKVTYKFTHNYSLWNNNFPNFLKELKKINPNVTISKFNLWNK